MTSFSIEICAAFSIIDQCSEFISIFFNIRNCIDLFFVFMLSRAPHATITYQQVKRALHRARLANIPANVVDVPSINNAFSLPENMDKFGKTLSGNAFYKTAYSCTDFSYCVFASDDIIEMIKDRIPIENRQFLMDATFKICPFGLFKQILIIYVSYLETVAILMINFSCK